MNERPKLRRKVTFKRRSNVIQLTTFFESLNQQYEQELKEQQEKKGSLAPEEEQKILSDSPYPFDFEEEEVENEEQDSNTETESASEQQLNGPASFERVAPSKKDVYPEKLNVKVTTINSSSNGDLKSETKKENPPSVPESNNNNTVEDDAVTKQSSSGKVANLKNKWELLKQQQEEEALKERQMREQLRAQKEAAMVRRKSKPHDVHITAPTTPEPKGFSTTTRPALIQPSPRPEREPGVSPTTPEKTPKDKKPKTSKSPKSPPKHKDAAEDKNNTKEPNGVENNGPSVAVTEPPAPQKPEPAEVESPKTISENIFSGNTKSQSDPTLQSNTNDQLETGDDLRNSMSSPNLPAQIDSGPTSTEVTTPKKIRDKDKKRDKDKSRTKTSESPKLKPKEKEKSRRSSSKKKDGELDNGPSSSGVNTNATNTPSKSGKEKESKDKESKDKDKKIAESESPSTNKHKRSSTDLYDKYNDTKPNKRNKTKRMLSANGVDGKSPKDKGRKKKKKKDPTIELTELKDSFARWKPTMLTHSWEIDGTDIEFIEKIGEGTSCSVYKGKFRNQIVALKVLKDLNEKQLDNFTKEFTIMSQFRSPDIVFFFGACIKPTPVMVLGYGERGSLYSVMKDPQTVLTWPIVVKVLHQVVRGLHSLHNWKPQIVHRDLKSRNILVDNDWQTKLCDFGESRQLVGNNLETLCKMRGTYAYISPEVYFGQSFTPKSDVYAFAIVAWELVTKCIKGTYQPPYSEFKTLIYDFQIIVQAARRGIRPTIDKACPVALASMIQRCWNHIPDVRPSTDHLLKFLEEIAAEPDPAKWINVPHVLEPPAYTMPPGGGPPPPSSTDREK